MSNLRTKSQVLPGDTGRSGRVQRVRNLRSLGRALKVRELVVFLAVARLRRPLPFFYFLLSRPLSVSPPFFSTLSPSLFLPLSLSPPLPSS